MNRLRAPQDRLDKEFEPLETANVFAWISSTELAGKTFTADFDASLHAYLKINGNRILLTGQSNRSVSGISFDPAQASSFAIKIPVGFQSALLGFPASEVTNTFIDLRDVAAFRNIQATANPEMTIAVLTEKTDELVRSDRVLAFFLNFMSHRLLSREEDPTVQSLAEASGYSSRHLSRIFLNYTGFSPKEFLEIRRFSRTTARFAGGNTAESIGAGNLYYDQSHLGRAFKKYSGLSPGAYTRRMSDSYNTGWTLQGIFIRT